MAAEEGPRTTESGAADSILKRNMAAVTDRAIGIAVPKPRSTPAVELADTENDETGYEQEVPVS